MHIKASNKRRTFKQYVSYNIQQSLRKLVKFKSNFNIYKKVKNEKMRGVKKGI